MNLPRPRSQVDFAARTTTAPSGREPPPFANFSIADNSSARQAKLAGVIVRKRGYSTIHSRRLASQYTASLRCCDPRKAASLAVRGQSGSISQNSGWLMSVYEKKLVAGARL